MPGTPSNRIILHIDFDYFYAQIEEIGHPEAKGRPIVVCMYSGRTADSGAVATANYVARQYGVKAGIPIFQARSKLQGTDALVLPARLDFYAEISMAIMNTLRDYADCVEPASIDEAYLDISTRCLGDYTRAQQLATEIKAVVRDQFHLTGSVGIAPNKLVAKIASDFEKPDGLTVVPPESVRSFLDPMDVDAIPGIGQKTRDFLTVHGVRTIHDLRKKDPGWILESFGKKSGAWLIAAAQGQDDSPVAVVPEQKQIGRIATLKQNTRDRAVIMNALRPLIEDVHREIQRSDLEFSSVGVYAVDERMQSHGKSRTLAHPSNDLDEIQKVAEELFGDLLDEFGAELRRVGVRVEKLASREGQKTLEEF